MGNLLNIEQVAERLNLRKSTVYKLCSAKRIPVTKITGRCLFDPEQIDAWVKERTQQPINNGGDQANHKIDKD